MRVEIRSKGKSTTEELEQYCERRIRVALGRFQARLSRVVVCLNDTNKPNTGEDKYCRVRAYFSRQSPSVVDATAGCMYSAVDSAMGRAARNVGRRLDKQRERPVTPTGARLFA